MSNETPAPPIPIELCRATLAAYTEDWSVDWGLLEGENEDGEDVEGWCYVIDPAGILATLPVPPDSWFLHPEPGVTIADFAEFCRLIAAHGATDIDGAGEA